MHESNEFSVAQEDIEYPCTPKKTFCTEGIHEMNADDDLIEQDPIQEEQSNTSMINQTIPVPPTLPLQIDATALIQSMQNQQQTMLEGQQQMMLQFMQFINKSTETSVTKEKRRTEETQVILNRAYTPHKDFKKGTLVLLNTDTLTDAEEWFIDFEQLLTKQNVHEADYITCLYSCCHPSFEKELLSQCKSSDLQNDYKKLRKHITKTYGPQFPLVMYTKALLSLEKGTVSIVEQLAQIEQCRIKYELAYAHYSKEGSKPHPTLDDDLCFCTLMEFLTPIAPILTSQLQEYYAIPGTKYVDIAQRIYKSMQRAPELRAYQKKLTGVNMVQARPQGSRLMSQPKPKVNKKKGINKKNRFSQQPGVKAEQQQTHIQLTGQAMLGTTSNAGNPAIQRNRVRFQGGPRPNMVRPGTGWQPQPNWRPPPSNQTRGVYPTRPYVVPSGPMSRPPYNRPFRPTWPPTCWNCQSDKHKIRDCPKAIRPNQYNTVSCAVVAEKEPQPNQVNTEEIESGVENPYYPQH